MQDSANVKTTEDLLKQKMRILIFANPKQTATGSIFIADGKVETEKTQYYKILYSQKTIRFDFQYVWGMKREETKDMNQIIERIDIVDQNVNDVDFSCAFDVNNNMIPVTITPEKKDGYTMFRITALENNILAFWNISRIHFGYTKTDFNYCNKNYILKSVDSQKPGEARMRVSKMSGTGKMKDLDIHIFDLGDDII